MKGEENTDLQVDSARGVDGEVCQIAHVRLLHAGTEVHDLPPAGLLIGRHVEDERGLSINDDHVSRRHARIGLICDGWYVVDLGSRNAGFVDGRPFASGEKVALTDGAVVRLGDSLFAFRVGEVPAPDAVTDDFPGVSPVAAAVRLRLRRLAQGVGHVLLIGETGTGKERAARAIGHDDAESVVPQNCAELNHDLARSELFGHVKGAFTGATSNRVGLVEAANDGVLFLDEIGELSLDLQAELLRFLEDGSYRVLGVPSLRRSTARVVAATNVDLDDAVRAGRFRRDLLARLRATNQPLILPPLRERRDDILTWALRFLREVAPDATDTPWNAGAAECLVLYPWPDNLRGLRGVVRGVGEHRRQWPITPADLPQSLRDHRASQRGEALLTPPARVGQPARSGLPSRADIERALRTTGGRMRRAAIQLGIDRRRLYRLCESHGIQVETYRHPGTRDE